MLKSVLFISILLIFAAFGAECAAEAPKKAATVEALHLKQTHYFLGELDIVAVKNGLRILSTGSWKFALVARAPDWKITVYRNDDKIYFATSLKQFSETGLVSQMLIGKKSMYAEGRDEPTDMTIGKVKVKRLKTQYMVCEYLPDKTLVVPQIETILYNTLRMPTCGGVALRWVQSKSGRDWMTGLPDHGQHAMLSTQTAKMESVSDSIFTPPTGYKLAKSLREVLISNASRDSSADAKDLFEINK